MKTRITARDVANTLLHEDTLRQFMRAGKASEATNREGCISPYIETRSWKPGCQIFHLGGFNTGFSDDSKERPTRDDPLEYMFIHFHPQECVLIPSGVEGDLSLLLRNAQGPFETKTDPEHYVAYRHCRNICGVANYTGDGIGILLFQLRTLHTAKAGSYAQQLVLKQLDEQLSRLHFPSQEAVVTTMNEYVNALHFRLPLPGLKNEERRDELKRGMRRSLERMLEPFATEIAVVTYEDSFILPNDIF